MPAKTLEQIVAEKPYQEFAQWWSIGPQFLAYMADAIYTEWTKLSGNSGDLTTVQLYIGHYIDTVYGRAARDGLASDFTAQRNLSLIQSGEFDALSYAFYRSAFELLAAHIEGYDHPLERERRLFTKRVGKRFFKGTNKQLRLPLPNSLTTAADFQQMTNCIQQVGAFLQAEGYLRDHFAFKFEVDLRHGSRHIKQRAASFIDDLNNQGTGYALYEMGYPVILPSAVYLYHTMGEAQHHSSRTIEELFGLVGYEARETDDFDPTGYPSDMVVELWEIRKL